MNVLTEAGQAELRRFGWTLGRDFERRYFTDPWVFNLANAVEAVAREREGLLDILEKLEVEWGVPPRRRVRAGKVAYDPCWLRGTEMTYPATTV